MTNWAGKMSELGEKILLIRGEEGKTLRKVQKNVPLHLPNWGKRQKDEPHPGARNGAGKPYGQLLQERKR